jgi:undecaprenyl-diphosphatase
MIFLNNLGSSTFDGLWLLITKQLNWAPYFAVILYLTYVKLGKKNFLYLLLFTALLLVVTDQSANLFKNYFMRLRPCNEPTLQGLIRVVKCSDTFSFYSGHATNSMATTVLVFSVLRPYYKYAALLFLFPLIFAYSRIYLGLHYPGDIMTGYLFGAGYGYLAFRLYRKYILKD